MKKQQLDELKKRLETDFADIDIRMAELKESDPFSDPEYSNDNAAVDNDVREQEAHQRIEAEIETLQERKKNIEQALKRMEKGNYGYCKRCNKEIPEKRLQLVPEASYCVECESLI
ncbi:MAG TPA: TraR/DksA family transcriptional regulator, partial [Candidatus Woesebacteria bacterium]|nr:TraR/DksA family transcriptional regulator [Candidatus Woesebacteria bacterium]